MITSRLVRLVVLPSRDGTVSTARISIERKTSNRDTVVFRQWDVVAGEVEATRQFLIHDDERLIVEAVPNTELVYDKEHNVVSVKRKREIEDDEL